MKKIMKKVIAIICAIAMVVSSVTVYNKTASAAVADLPESGPGVKIEVNDFGNGEVLFVAGLDTITGATSYNLYVDGTFWGTVINGANLEITNFPSGAHTFCVTGVNAVGEEIAKSRDISVSIPNHGAVTTPEVVDGEELLKGVTFTDADTTTNEASTEVLWMELSQNNAVFTNNGDGSVSVSTPAYESGDNWATQLKQNQVQLVQNKWYTAKFTVTSDVDKSIQLLIQQNVEWTVFAEKIVSVAAGATEEVELTFQATQTTNKVLFGIMMGYVDNTACEAANVTISNVSLKGYNTNPNGGEVPSDETTTPDGSGEVPSDVTTTPDGSGEQPSNETTTPGNVDPAGPEYTEAAGSTALNSATYLGGEVGANQYKAVLGRGVVNEIVNIQKFGAATDYGIYVSFFDANFGEMTVNGKPLNTFVDGAGIIMYLSNFEYMYNDVVIKNGDGTEKAVIYVYNAQGIDNSDKVIEVPTEPTTDPSDTETTTPDGSGEQPSQDDRTYAAAYDWLLIGLLPSGIEEARGQYRAVCGSGQVSEIVNIQQAGNAAEPGIYVTFEDANFGDITVNGVPLACNIEGSGITMYVSNFEYMYSDVVVRNGDGTEKAVIYVCNWGGIDNSDKAISTPVEPTTPQPTTPQQTTPQQTTPQSTTPQQTTPSVVDPTTVAPTTATSTTVAPTTATTSKVVAPRKTKVKLATKKKAVKKVKLSIKKVEDANGYRVQFSTTKKFKKVLVTKDVNKVKLTITSKKLKKATKLYVRVKAYKLDGEEKVLAKKWSKAKKVVIK